MNFSICSSIHSFFHSFNHPEEHQVWGLTENVYIKQFKTIILELLLNYTKNKNDTQVGQQISKSRRSCQFS